MSLKNSPNHAPQSLIAPLAIGAGLVAAAVAVASYVPTATPKASQVAPAPVAAAAPVAAPADSPTHAPTPATPLAAHAAPASTPETAAPDGAVAMSGQRAYLDPKTGRLRETEHDDFATAAAPAAAKKAAPATMKAASVQEFELEGGGVAREVPEELQTFMVATRTADGRIVIGHATGAKQARTKMNNAGKETRNDR